MTSENSSSSFPRQASTKKGNFPELFGQLGKCKSSELLGLYGKCKFPELLGQLENKKLFIFRGTDKI